MKLKRNILVCLALVPFFVPTASAQDLSKYRDFSLGESLSALAKQIAGRPEDARVLYQNPASIQDLNWWPSQSDQSMAAQSVEDVTFSFFNGALYKIAVTYSDAATKGMTDDDMVQALSAKYGVTVRPTPVTPRADPGYDSNEVQLAVWENPQYSVNLSRSPLSQSFQLVTLSKQVGAQADAAIAEAKKKALEDAPAKEAARVKQDADDVEGARETNLKSFQP